MKGYRLRRPLALAVLFLLLALVPPVQAAAPAPVRTLPQVADPAFVFDAPLPQRAPVSSNWFADAAFIGDSRTDAQLSDCGLMLGQMGLNVRSAYSGAEFLLNGERVSLTQALAESGCAKIYLMLGLNEASWMSEEEFYDAYADLIDLLRRTLPNAQIYLQTILPVTVSRATSRGPDNALLAQRNDLIRRLARDKQVYLLDVAPVFTGANGALTASLSTDGFHLSPEGYALWYDYLRTHTMGT